MTENRELAKVSTRGLTPLWELHPHDLSKGPPPKSSISGLESQHVNLSGDTNIQYIMISSHNGRTKLTTHWFIVNSSFSFPSSFFSWLFLMSHISVHSPELYKDIFTQNQTSAMLSRPILPCLLSVPLCLLSISSSSYTYFCLCVCVYVCKCTWACHSVCVALRGILEELVFSVHQMGLWDQTQVIRIDSKYLYT